MDLNNSVQNQVIQVGGWGAPQNLITVFENSIIRPVFHRKKEKKLTKVPLYVLYESVNISFSTQNVQVCTKIAKNPNVMAVPTIEQVFSLFGRQNPCAFIDFNTSKLLFLFLGIGDRMGPQEAILDNLVHNVDYIQTVDLISLRIFFNIFSTHTLN